MPLQSRRNIRTGLPTARRHLPDTNNRRGDQRFRYVTSVVLLNRTNRYPATTIDVSNTGARIRLERPVILEADCLFAAPCFGILIPSVVVWRRGLELGVRFMSGEEISEPEWEARNDFGRRRAKRPQSKAQSEAGPTPGHGSIRNPEQA